MNAPETLFTALRCIAMIAALAIVGRLFFFQTTWGVDMRQSGAKKTVFALRLWMPAAALALVVFWMLWK